MNRNLLARRSAAYYLRSHLGVLAGTAVAAAVLAGALIVGDSVRYSLRRQALARLAGGAFALDARDHFFRADLMDRVAAPGSNAVPASVAAWLAAPRAERGFCALDLPASAAQPDDSSRANRVRVLGVEPAGFPPLRDARPDQVWLNASLARQLRAAPGDLVVLRVRKPGSLPGDAAISPRDDAAVALRLTVGGVLDSAQGGDLMLAANQQAPFNAFLRLDTLAAAVGVPGQANLALVRSPEGVPIADLSAFLDARLGKVWTAEDSELSLRLVAPDSALTGGEPAPEVIELSSRRIFIEPEIADDLPGRTIPGFPAAVGVVTYLVNAIEAHGALTPYSMVAAAGPPYTPSDLAEDEIVVDQWLADDLSLRPGDAVKLTYYQPDQAQLVERSAQFKVRAVLPMRGAAVDRTLMPEFPGIAKAESTKDWNSGFELTHRIRDKDEAYWKTWRGAPKAFIHPTAGARMWGNRYGRWTSIRWPAGAGRTRDQLAADLAGLRGRFSTRPSYARFNPLREAALGAASGGQDFGGLFIGLSLFLIVAALLLIGMLFRFSLEQRAREIGLLLALGWPSLRVRGVLFREGLWIALAGSVLGSALGAGYGWAIIRALGAVWRDAAAGARLEFHPTPEAPAGGFAVGALCAAVVMWFGLARLVRRPARDLLSEGRLESGLEFFRAGRAWRSVVAGILLAAGLGMTAAAEASGKANPGLVFGAGAVLAAGGLAATSAWLRRLAGRRGPPAGLVSVALRGLARRPGRTLGVSALLASAVFLLGSVGAFKRSAAGDAGARSSGAGGFALWAESSLPVFHDLNTRRGRDAFGLEAKAMEGVSVVPLRVRDGDEASCLNLNLATRPRLLAVDPAALASRGAFSFAAGAPGVDVKAGWTVLMTNLPPENGVPVIPAVGDAEGIEWIMKRSLGDTLDYTDASGRPFKVRLVAGLENSILQGSLVVSERDFLAMFPAEPGWRAFLIDAPAAGTVALSAVLSRALRDTGIEITPTAVRLDAFNAVQNTYLQTFGALGALGLLLGSVGLGVVVRRNLFERRNELALLQILGFPPSRVLRLIMIEHGALLILGLAAGALAAAPAVLPSAAGGDRGSAAGNLAVIVLVVGANGLFWSWLAARKALKAPPSGALAQL
jgi:putative ABC transport system permease protein